MINRNPVLDTIKNHRSIRRFKKGKIDREVIKEIVSAGIRAATAGNLQQYSIIVVDDKEKLKDLGVVNVPLAIIVLADQNRLTRWFTMNGSSKLVNNKAQNLFISLWDALIALQNMVLAAESMGLGTFYYGDILSLDIKKHLSAPDYTFPAGMVCMGYPEETPELSMRLPIEAVLHMNSYQIPMDEQIKEWYEERETIWEKVPQNRKEVLAKEGINNLPQAIAVQKFSNDFIDWRSEGILRNLREAKFVLETK